MTGDNVDFFSLSNDARTFLDENKDLLEECQQYEDNFYYERKAELGEDK